MLRNSRALAGKLLSSVCVFLVATIICLVALEFTFRAAVGVSVFSFPDWRRAGNTDLTGISEYDAVVGWRTKEGVRSNWINTIAYGIRRNHDTDTSIRTGGILAVGDSFTAGTNVNDDQTWPAYLEGIEHKPVLNAGVGGWGIDQMVLRVGQLLDTTKPKTVIIAIQDSLIPFDLYAASEWPKPYFLLQDGHLTEHNSPVPAVVYNGSHRVAFAFKEALGHSFIADRVLGQLAPDWWYSTAPTQFVKIGDDPVSISCALGKLFVDQSRTAGFRPVFVLEHPGSDIANARPEYDAKILSCFTAEGIQVIDLYDMLRLTLEQSTEEFQSLYQESPPGYGHMTALGNKKVASWIAAGLSNSGD